MSFEFLILSWEDEKVLNFVSPADWLCYTIRHSPLAIRKSSFFIDSSSLTPRLFYEISPSFAQIFVMVCAHAGCGGADGWSGIGNLGGASGRDDGGGSGDRGVRLAGVGKRTL
ncbi:MAG: hypothetical protein LH647_19415 [Leptolyngbyaceae cyanobacterium CAN_BIN12]|nr:hypothetical protein [Leptolyngbyaceae cyanobacterium CAN_BIN12]